MEAYPTDISLFFAACWSSSVIRITPMDPAPPTASITRLNLSSLCLNRFTWCIAPSGEAAKNTRSVTSHASDDIGRGNWKVVKSVPDDRSQAYRPDQ